MGSEQFAFFADGLDVDLLEGLDQKNRRRAALQAINKIARDARADAARRILSQVALPASYVEPGSQRLYVSKQATGADLEARITARGRATSLARYVTGSTRVGAAGVNVVVHPGQARFMKRAFLIRLPGTGGSTDLGQANMGLAIRLRPGETLNKSVMMKRVETGLYLLYGPSVAQVFRSNDGTGVANEMTPEIAEKLQDEFLRLLGL